VDEHDRETTHYWAERTLFGPNARYWAERTLSAERAVRTRTSAPSFGRTKGRNANNGNIKRDEQPILLLGNVH